MADKKRPKIKTPTSVNVIGWIFIVASGLSIIGSLFNVLFSHFMFRCLREQGQWPPPMPHAEMMPSGFGMMMSFTNLIMRHHVLVTAITMAVSVFVLVSGIKFLKRRAWARKSLEVVSWCLIVLMVIYAGFFGVFFSRMFDGIGQTMPPGDCAPPPALFKTFGIVVMVFSLAVYAVPLGVIIKFLRGKAVRAAMLG